MILKLNPLKKFPLIIIRYTDVCSLQSTRTIFDEFQYRLTMSVAQILIVVGDPLVMHINWVGVGRREVISTPTREP